MDIRKKINDNLNNVIAETDFVALGEKYEGKVRDCYSTEKEMYIITSDRISCFDHVITTVPFKGQILTDLACFWFELTKDVFPNHLISRLDPNVMLVKKCEILPIEIIVRGYLTGSAYRDYKAGKDISGIKLPEGLKNSHKFSEALITPSTKAPKGEHDLPISEAEILSSKIIDPVIWEKVRTAALELFAFGQAESLKRGLILVDTKYEFGICDGEILIADEIHTLDSSRYWKADTYQTKYEVGDSPEMLDKENIRQWLIERNYMGDGEVPEIPDEYRAEIAELYIKSYQTITGQNFIFPETNIGERLHKSLSL